MKYEVVVETAQAELVAAVRSTVSISEVAQAWKPALDQVSCVHRLPTCRRHSDILVGTMYGEHSFGLEPTG